MPLAHTLILGGFFGGVAATLLILEDFTALALAASIAAGALYVDGVRRYRR